MRKSRGLPGLCNTINMTGSFCFFFSGNELAVLNMCLGVENLNKIGNLLEKFRERKSKNAEEINNRETT